jgi:hypothetical protein
LGARRINTRRIARDTFPGSGRRRKAKSVRKRMTIGAVTDRNIIMLRKELLNGSNLSPQKTEATSGWEVPKKV